MKNARLFKDGLELLSRVEIADTSLERMRGLLGRNFLSPGHGMLLRPAGSIHTWFMRFPIDVCFLDRHGLVVKVVPGMRSWRMAWGGWCAHSVLETCAGSLQGKLSIGDVVEIAGA